MGLPRLCLTPEWLPQQADCTLSSPSFLGQCLMMPVPLSPGQHRAVMLVYASPPSRLFSIVSLAFSVEGTVWKQPCCRWCGSQVSCQSASTKTPGWGPCSAASVPGGFAGTWILPSPPVGSAVTCCTIPLSPASVFPAVNPSCPGDRFLLWCFEAVGLSSSVGCHTWIASGLSPGRAGSSSRLGWSAGETLCDLLVPSPSGLGDAGLRLGTVRPSGQRGSTATSQQC